MSRLQLLCLAVAFPAAAQVPNAPALPRTVVALPPEHAARERVVRVPAGADLQAALDAARGGDRLVLPAGAVYRGAFLLRRRAPDDTAWITVVGGTPPARGTRVTPADSGRLARLVGGLRNQAVLRAEPGAHHVRLVGVEVTADSAVPKLNALVRFERGDSGRGPQPHHLVLERSYVHGSPDLALTRCVLGNVAAFALVDSYVTECHTKGTDSQAFVAWDSPGPYLLQNNTLEGAGENVMFGGAASRDSASVPADITVRGNTITKPAAWKGRWTVKNLFELKAARRVLVEGNLLAGNWVDGQAGDAVNLKSGMTGRTPWSVTEDVTFRRDTLRDSPSGIKLTSRPNGGLLPLRRVRLEGNVLEGMTQRLFQVVGDVEDVALVGNRGTFAPGAGVAALTLGGQQGARLTVTGNVWTPGRYGVKGGGTPEGAASLARYWTGVTWSGNTLVGASAAQRARYPGDAPAP